MKILYTNFHQGDGGGHTTYVMSLARMLRQRAHITVAAPRGSRLLAEAHALPGVHSIDLEFKGRPFQQLSALRRLRTLRPSCMRVVALAHTERERQRADELLRRRAVRVARDHDDVEEEDGSGHTDGEEPLPGGDVHRRRRSRECAEGVQVRNLPRVGYVSRRSLPPVGLDRIPGPVERP